MPRVSKQIAIIRTTVGSVDAVPRRESPRQAESDLNLGDGRVAVLDLIGRRVDSVTPPRRCVSLVRVDAEEQVTCLAGVSSAATFW